MIPPIDTDLTKSGVERVLEEVRNSDLQEHIDINSITLSLPKLANSYGRNTRITAVVTENSVVVNSIAIYVTRYDLGETLTAVTANEMDLTGAVTTHDVLPMIDSLYNIKLDPEDIIDEDLSTNGNTMTAATYSYGWVGSVTFTGTILMFATLFRTLSDTLITTLDGRFLTVFTPLV